MATKQCLQREESAIAANYLVHCREKETNENILKRINRNARNIDSLQERLDRKRIESIKRAYEEKTVAKIAQDILRQARVILKEKKRALDPVDDEEILRRYSLLTANNVAKCVKLSFATLNNLNAYYSTWNVIHESVLFLERLVIAVRMRPSESIRRINYVR